VPFFPVDDRFHSHPKTAAVSLAAIGLWALAGSWANEHLTDGDVPAHMIPSLSRGATELADELVAVGLWRRTKAGYRFHQWHADGDGSHRNISKSEVSAMREKKSSGGALGNHRRWHAARGVTDPGCAFCSSDTDRTRRRNGSRPIAPPIPAGSEGGATGERQASSAVADEHRKRVSDTDRTSDRTSDDGSDATPNPPTPPHPTPISGTGGEVTHPSRAEGSDPPQERCPQHLMAPADGPCGPCGDARRLRQQWEAGQARSDAVRRSAAARERAELRRVEIGNCDLCDPEGYLPSGRACGHDPSRTGNAARGAAAARAAIQERATEASKGSDR
jgi:hypothetical protein